MRVKKVKIGIKSLKDVLNDTKEAMRKLERGEKVKPEKELYFESIKGFRKAITPKRVELLHVIKEKHPKSLQELARLSKRDIKSIVTDIAILEELGLVDMKRKKEGRKESIPTVEYNKINLEIAV
ncbi:MAG: putative transcriptional regulator [Candidatus Jettenia ecosi]|uniref:Putative transcriptional regulator n=1 Tax=Candidatus Jettenia ecosi TaxID=2494326 RepID=A0A533QDG1_9BACT|nr:MAG: putative transcriptional regulator [Candidatus Jettenia ecosi]